MPQAKSSHHFNMLLHCFKKKLKCSIQFVYLCAVPHKKLQSFFRNNLTIKNKQNIFLLTIKDSACCCIAGTWKSMKNLCHVEKTLENNAQILYFRRLCLRNKAAILKTPAILLEKKENLPNDRNFFKPDCSVPKSAVIPRSTREIKMLCDWLSSFAFWLSQMPSTRYKVLRVTTEFKCRDAYDSMLVQSSGVASESVTELTEC